MIEDDITFTLLGVIADESGMVISYRIEAPFDLQKIDTKKIKIYQNGKELEAGYSYNGFATEPTYVVEDQVEVTAVFPLNYDNPSFEFKLVLDNPEQTTFHFPFTLTKEIKKTVTYPIEQTIEMDGQKLTVHELTISPLRAGITLSPDAENTMQILYIEQIQLMDENGEEWGSITNGISGWGGNYDSTRTLFIQSNYFRKPKQLFLKLGGIQALPKKDHYIELDFSKKEIIYQPSDLPIEISDITNRSFVAMIPNSSETFHYGMFSDVFDANGQMLHISSSSHTIDDEFMSFQPHLGDNEFINPVRFFIHAYPNCLDGEATVQINLK